jgi:hypothetical protein
LIVALHHADGYGKPIRIAGYDIKLVLFRYPAQFLMESRRIVLKEAQIVVTTTRFDMPPILPLYSTEISISIIPTHEIVYPIQ